MHLLYNNDLLQEQDLYLPRINRAFQYNDGFFETMLVCDGAIRFWRDHVARMQEAADALHINIFASINAAQLEAKLLYLAHQNNAATCGRIKLKIWRDGAGLYTPQTDDAAWLATGQPTQPLPDTPLQVGICQTINTQPSPFAFCKGPNALVYVMAGREKTQTEYDDLLLLSPDGVVAELISSNIYWFQEGKLYTPALDTGCVNGIVRRNILRWAAAQAIHVITCRLAPDTLQQAEVIFSSNITGIRQVNMAGTKPQPHVHPQLQQLQQALFSPKQV